MYVLNYQAKQLTQYNIHNTNLNLGTEWLTSLAVTQLALAPVVAGLNPAHSNLVDCA